MELDVKPPAVEYRNPEILSTEMPVAYRYEPYSWSIPIKYGLPDYTCLAEGLPNSFEIDKKACQITGIYKEKFEGVASKEFIIKLTAIDKKGNQSLPLETKLIIRERIEEISQLAITTTQAEFDKLDSPPQVGNKFHFELKSVGGNRKNTTWKTTINDNTKGILANPDTPNFLDGKPTSYGPIVVNTTVSDGIDSETKSFQINVKPEDLVVHSPDKINSVVGREIKSFSATASGGVKPYKFIKVENLPKGLSFIQTKEDIKIIGKPEESGLSTLKFSFTDKLDTSKSKETELTIAEPLKISTETLPNASIGKVYSTNLISEGGITPYRWTLQTKSSWLTLSDKGQLGGIPNNDLPLNFTVKVTDKDGFDVSKNLVVTARASTNIVLIQTP